MAGPGARDEQDDRTFGAWLRDQLVAQQLSQASLVRAIGAHSSVVSRWLNDRDIPRPRSCERLALALGVRPEEVLARAGHLALVAPEAQRLSDQLRAAAARARTLESQVEQLRRRLAAGAPRQPAEAQRPVAGDVLALPVVGAAAADHDRLAVETALVPARWLPVPAGRRPGTTKIPRTAGDLAE